MRTGERSVTEVYSPGYRRSKLSSKNQPSLDFVQQYKQLQSKVIGLQLTMNQRMAVHEKDLIDIMKSQVCRILQDLKKIIKTYNLMIAEKNLSQELWETRNQMDFFKYEAELMFKQNHRMKKQIDALKHKNKQLEAQADSNKIIIRKLKYKKLKQEFRTQRRHKTVQSEKNLNSQKPTVITLCAQHCLPKVAKNNFGSSREKKLDNSLETKSEEKIWSQSINNINLNNPQFVTNEIKTNFSQQEHKIYSKIRNRVREKININKVKNINYQKPRTGLINYEK